MRNKVVLISVALILVFGLVIGGCAKTSPAPAPTPSPAPAPTEPIVLESLTAVPSTDASMGKYMEWIDIVNERAAGKLTIENLGGPEVIGMFDQAEALRTGLIDVNATYAPFISPACPIADAMLFTELKPSEERERGVYEVYDEIFEPTINAKYLGQFFIPQEGYMWTNVRVENPKTDFAGLKIRGLGQVTFMDELGCKQINVPLSEIYTGMERGVFDGFTLNSSTFADLKLWDVTKYCVGPNWMAGNGGSSAILINLDVWNNLPKELQGLIQDVVIEKEDIWFEEWVKTNAETMQLCLDQGVEQIDWSEEHTEWYLETITELNWEFARGKDPHYAEILESLLRK